MLQYVALSTHSIPPLGRGFQTLFRLARFPGKPNDVLEFAFGSKIRCTSIESRGLYNPDKVVNFEFQVYASFLAGFHEIQLRSR